MNENIKKSNFILYDLECYENYFEAGFKDYISKEVLIFEVSEDIDQRKELYQFLISYKGFLISFNGVHYDNVLSAFFIKEFSRLSKLKVLDFLKEMKKFSNLIIEDNFDSIKKYKWYKHSWTDIDLYLYWAKSLRISKKISLKSLGIQLGYPEVQELPYHHTSILTREEREEVKRYNSINDLGVLDMLCKKMQAEIKLRQYIQQEYGLSCWSMDAPKICSEYLLDDYCKRTFDHSIDFENYKRETRKKRYTPDYWKIGDYLPEVKFKTKFFQDLYKEIKLSDNTFEKIFVYKNNLTNVVVSMGVGRYSYS